MSHKFSSPVRSFARISCCVIAGCLLPLATFAYSTQEQMATRARESVARNSGYEMVSIQQFWGDGAYLKECANKDKPVPRPFTIYFEVLPDGKLGELLLAPETEFGRCIRAHIAGRRFTKPPGTYVTKIDMSFKP